MNGIGKFFWRNILWLLILVQQGSASAPSYERRVPTPLAAHPGNIFFEGEEVSVPLAVRGAGWTLFDSDGRILAEPDLSEGRAVPGRLPAGFYRLEQASGSNWVSLGVLTPLSAPTPASSPIALDVGMAWFYPQAEMDAVANLCALAGVNWVRDRLSWPEMEPEKGHFAPANKYDFSALAQARAGLRVLQVVHASPGWANPNETRFPLDLRDAYRFFEAMAARWRGQVLAFELWNEADIPMFGGHTGAEMAAMQKASYLGLKAGNPDVLACMNVLALHKTNQLSDLFENRAWPYCDTYNLHHYEPFDKYPKLYADHRAISAGRPLWVSESSVPVKWAGDPRLKEPSDKDLKIQAERVPKIFAASLHEGSAATFYFLLPNYAEGSTQFGILRADLTPRPAYVALAAVGRLLADAKPLGRLATQEGAIRAYFFRAKPGGRESDVLVAWSTNPQSGLSLPAEPRQLFDYLGRPQKLTRELSLGPAPVFVIFPKGTARKLDLVAPPAAPPRLKERPSPVVLQAIWPADKIDLNLSAYRISSRAVNIPVVAYNFGRSRARGRLQVAAPMGWNLQFPDTLDLAPMERRELTLFTDTLSAPPKVPATVHIQGDFAGAGKPVLSFRLISEP